MKVREVRTPLLDGGARGLQDSAKRPGDVPDAVSRPLFPGLSCAPAPSTTPDQEESADSQVSENSRQLDFKGI